MQSLFLKPVDESLFQFINRSFESEIDNYQGDDPLELWYDYISWTEQTFPKQGHEGSLIQLLEKCLTTFESDPKYSQDRRFCRLWIKYVSAIFVSYDS